MSHEDRLIEAVARAIGGRSTSIAWKRERKNGCGGTHKWCDSRRLAPPYTPIAITMNGAKCRG